MGVSTSSSDFIFDPKVWHDHVQAYFDDKLVYGAFALRNKKLTGEGTGVTVDFPYYNTIGDAEEPLENEALTVDNMSDDSFSVSVFEVGKAIGVKKKAFKKSADSKDGILSEAQSQMAQRHAEKVDDKLITEIHLASSHDDVSPGGAAAASMNVRELNKARITAFGDKMDDADVCFMHSFQYLDFTNDTVAGFLKADANDPAFLVEGFMGRFLGMAIVVADSTPVVAGLGANQEYGCTLHKMNAFGIIEKQEIEFDKDKDVLTREVLVTSNQWYGVKSFHKKISPLDRKSARLRTKATANI